MEKKIIELVAKPNNRLVPRENGPAQVKTGQPVIFKLPPGGSGGQVTFVGRSPFGMPVLQYNTEVPVRSQHQANDRDANLFKYSCKGTINGQEFHTDSGGEIEIIRT